jgi:hypothetical protein
VKEIDLAAAVVRHLQDLHWDVHQEVGGPYGARADIVAVQGPLLYVVETKTTLGLAVIGQAYHWLARAHYVSVAVPWGRRVSPDRQCAERILGEWGIGLLIVSLSELYDGSRVHEEVAPRLWRRIPRDGTDRLREFLNDGTRTYAQAGNAEGKFWSPFKETVRQVQQAVHHRPGITTRELIDSIRHHYSTDRTARSVLLRWLWLGKIPGVRGVGERPVRWFPTKKDVGAVA